MKRTTVFRILSTLSSLLLFQITAGGANDSVVGQKKDQPSFSFRYAEQSFETIRAGWSVTQEQKRLDDKRLQRIITFSAPQTPLLVKCEVIDYPLFPHKPDNSLWFGYQFHRNDMDAGIALLFRREKNAEPEKAIQLKGLNPDSAYEVSFEGSEKRQVVNGGELADFKVQIPEAPGSLVLYYQKKD